MNNKSTSQVKSQNSTHINIHDCLKMIGMKELTANVYCIPSKKTQNQ